MYQKNDSGNGGSPLNIIIGLAFMVLLLFGAFFFFRLLFRLLYFIGPVLLIIALLVDYKGVLAYFSWLRKLLKQDTAMGVVAVLLSILGYPIVSIFLLGRTLLRKKVDSIHKEIQKRQEGELTDYEELDSRQLPPLPDGFREERRSGTKDNDFV
jgi:hypothetical protein